jgi:hypothetical protein
LEILLVKSFLLKREQIVGRHPASRGVCGTTDHGQSIGLNLDPWFAGRLFHRSLVSKSAFQQVGCNVLEFAPLMHGPKFHRPD